MKQYLGLYVTNIDDLLGIYWSPLIALSASVRAVSTHWLLFPPPHTHTLPLLLSFPLAASVLPFSLIHYLIMSHRPSHFETSRSSCSIVG